MLISRAVCSLPLPYSESGRPGQYVSREADWQRFAVPPAAAAPSGPSWQLQSGRTCRRPAGQTARASTWPASGRTRGLSSPQSVGQATPRDEHWGRDAEWWHTGLECSQLLSLCGVPLVPLLFRAPPLAESLLLRILSLLPLSAHPQEAPLGVAPLIFGAGTLTSKLRLTSGACCHVRTRELLTAPAAGATGREQGYHLLRVTVPVSTRRRSYPPSRRVLPRIGSMPPSFARGAALLY